MPITKGSRPGPGRANPGPTVLDALRSPRLLTREALAGLVVGLALIPEAISFSVIAGVDPRVGLFSSFLMAVTIAFVGGRPAMVSAATGAVALVVAPVAPTHGLDFLIATVILAGLFQILLGLFGVAKLMRFIPRSVMVGFINSLALFVLIAQFPHLFGVPWLVYPLVAVGVLVIVAFPRVTQVVPAPLVAIIVLTVVVLAFGIDVPNVADQGELPRSLPSLFIPDVPLTWETLQIIAPYSLAMAVVGLMESLLTAKLVDDVTDTHSNKTRESWGQGIANIVTGLFGGMGGCAVIGQTMINTKVSGARTRVSTFLAGVFLLVLCLLLGDIVGLIPMAALVAVMIMVVVTTFDWYSIRPSTLRRMPRSETLVLFSTMGLVMATNNLAVGVIGGVLVASLLFVRRVARFVDVERAVDGGTARYKVTGQLLFASSNDLTTLFSYTDDPGQVVIDLTDSRIWDVSTIAAIDAIVTKYARHGKTVEIIGLDAVVERFRTRHSGQLGAS